MNIWNHRNREDDTTKGQRVVELFRDYFEDHGLWEILEDNGVNTDAVLESLGESMMLLVDDE